MKLRDKLFSVTITILVLINCTLVLKAEPRITARYMLSSVDSVALTLASDAKLLLANSIDVDTAGKAESWNYLYSSIANAKEYYFHTENTSVIYDSSKDMRFGIAPVDSNWIDSDSALYLAELSGGFDFRTFNPESKITAQLYKIVYPPFDTYWDIQYMGIDSSIIIRINAITGQVITSAERNTDRVKHPASFMLFQNYPNPFNSQTRIKFTISRTSFVTLKIMNLSGQEVRTLLKEERSAGNYEVMWDGRDNFNQQVSSGIYMYQFTSKDFSQTHKMILLQ